MSRLRLLLALLAALMLAFPAAAGAATRTFWVGAVQTTWNVIPNERDGIMGEHFEPGQTIFPTVHYRRFTPGWKRVLPNPSGVAGHATRERSGRPRASGCAGPRTRRARGSTTATSRVTWAAG
jgi:hypothetical protein